MKKISRRAFMFFGAITLTVPAWLTWTWRQTTRPIRALLPARTQEPIPVEHIVTRTLEDGTVVRVKEHWLVEIKTVGHGRPYLDELRLDGAEGYDGKEGLARRWACDGCETQFGYNPNPFEGVDDDCLICGCITYHEIWVDPCAEAKASANEPPLQFSSEERMERIRADHEAHKRHAAAVKPFTGQEKEDLAEAWSINALYEDRMRRGLRRTPLDDTELQAMKDKAYKKLWG